MSVKSTPLGAARFRAHRLARLARERDRLIAAGVTDPAIAARCALALEHQRRRTNGSRPPSRTSTAQQVTRGVTSRHAEHTE